MFGRERRRNGMNCWRLAKELSVGRGRRVLAAPGVEKRRSCVSDVEVDVVCGRSRGRGGCVVSG
jgi:hypothetical protein